MINTFRFWCNLIFKDYSEFLNEDFWYALNLGWWSMEYDFFIHNFDETSLFVDSRAICLSTPYESPDPFQIFLSEKDYDTLVDVMNNPKPPTPFMRQLLSQKPPWNDD